MTGAPPVLYRLHPCLLVYAAPIAGERVLIAEVSASQPPLILRHPRIAGALAVLPERFTEDEAVTHWSTDECFEQHATALWRVLYDEGLVVIADADDPMLHRFDDWERFGWGEASIYQEGTRDYPFLKMDEPDAFPTEEARMVEYVSAAAPPSVYQTRPHDASLTLPPRLTTDAVPSVYLAGMDSAQRRGREGLGFLLDLCHGERGAEPFGVQGSFLRKTIPSGGARHPTEVFFAAFANAPIEVGVYHYNVEHHRLDVVNPGDHSAAFEDATFDLFQKYERPPFGILIYTSLVERAMWRYREARSARAVFVDIGHALMAYRSVCAALGIEVYTYQKFRDGAVCKLLRIDPRIQPPLFVGTLV